MHFLLVEFYCHYYCKLLACKDSFPVLNNLLRVEWDLHLLFTHSAGVNGVDKSLC